MLSIGWGLFKVLIKGADDLTSAFKATSNFAGILESAESMSPEGALAKRKYIKKKKNLTKTIILFNKMGKKNRI